MVRNQNRCCPLRESCYSVAGSQYWPLVWLVWTQFSGQPGINMLLHTDFFKARASLYTSLSLKNEAQFFGVLQLIILAAFLLFQLFWAAIVCFQVQVMLHCLRLRNRMIHPVTHARDFGRKQIRVFSQKLICLFQQKFKNVLYCLKSDMDIHVKFSFGSDFKHKRE